VITHYIAEFFNTLTSLAYIAYGIHGIRRFKRHDVGIFSSPNISYWGLIGVGIFSGLYHTTLKYHTQMSDELSMHLSIGCLLHQIFTFQEPPHIQRRNTAIILGVLIPFFIYHFVADEFIVHVILFFCMSWIVAFRTRYLIATRIKEETDRAKIRGLVTFATWSAVISYGIWNVDVHMCPTLTNLKHRIGKPWDVLLELHGYWHLGTAVSAYIFNSIVEFLISPEDSASHGVGFAWPVKHVLRDVAPKKPTANGHVSKEATATNGRLSKKTT